MRRGQFRTHLQKQRCVIPAAGFYEWREEGGKQPYYFSRKDGPAMRHPFRRFWSRIEVVAAPAVPPADAHAAALQDRVLTLRGDWL